MNPVSAAFYSILLSLAGMVALDSDNKSTPVDKKPIIQNYDSTIAVSQYRAKELYDANEQGIREVKARQ